MTIFLSGPMGSGKTTLARTFARDGGSMVDLDEAIAARHGASIAELFRTLGEPGFRAIERTMAMELASGGHALVALGGGTVTDRATRRALLRAGVLVTLTAPLDVLVSRLEGDRTRPLLDDAGLDRRATLRGLIEARAEAYAECHATLDTSTLDLETQRVALVRLAETRPLCMPLGTRSYPVYVGLGARADAVAAIGGRQSPSQIVYVCDENTAGYASQLRVLLERTGRPTAALVVLTPGETHKTLAAVETIWDAALQARIDRSAIVLAVGGGVVGDLAGFAASTLLRGVSFAQVPTTLLAMVDASVGGKTGFDRREGKNLIGAFHQPRLVACDLDVLETLPEREYRSGLAEVLKAAWLTGEDDVAALERDAAALAARRPDAVEGAVRRSIATKIGVVSEDEHEHGRRAHLNLGHTLGHAIEAASDYARTHGECVALGMIAALRIALALGDASQTDLTRLVSLLGVLGLPTDLDVALLDPRLETFLTADKKRDASMVRFVVPGRPGLVRLEKLAPGRILALARTA